ncbi:GGDEF domain-containing protein, partial [Pseudoalteromonas sp. S1649]
MERPAVPVNEQARLEEILSLDVLESQSDPAFDRFS